MVCETLQFGYLVKPTSDGPSEERACIQGLGSGNGTQFGGDGFHASTIPECTLIHGPVIIEHFIQDPTGLTRVPAGAYFTGFLMGSRVDTSDPRYGCVFDPGLDPSGTVPIPTWDNPDGIHALLTIDSNSPTGPWGLDDTAFRELRLIGQHGEDDCATAMPTPPECVNSMAASDKSPTIKYRMENTSGIQFSSNYAFGWPPP